MDSIFDCFPKIKPTDSQKQALFQLSMFPQSENRVFILKGYAGTGKTTLLEGLIKFYKSRNIPTVCMAPTGRAARILTHKTGTEARTIHTTIYKRKPIDFSKDDLKIEFYINPETPQDGTIGIIDESSMVSDLDSYDENEGLRFGTGKLLSDVFTFFKMADNKKSKLIFIGDGAQLAPVNSPISVALQADYIRRTFDMPVIEAELTEVKRHDNLILSAATYVRNKIITETFDSYKPPTGNEVKIASHKRLTRNYLLQFPDVHASTKGILIAGSNKKALEYNQTVRNKFFPYHQGMVQPMDRLIVSANNYLEGKQLMNGEFVRVLEVGSIKSKNFNFPISQGTKVSDSPVVKKNSNTEIEVELIYQKMKIQLQNRAEYEMYFLPHLLKSNRSSLEREVRRALFVDFVMRSKEKYQGLPEEDLRRKMSEDMYRDPLFNSVQARYGYAITCHKSQGGEWDYVFLNTCTRPENSATENHFRWVYTGMTRARKGLMLGVPNF